MTIYPVVLCGGGGSRLWPASTPASPKQFLPLIGDKSTYQMALERAAQLPHSAPPIVVTGAATADIAVEQAVAINIDPRLIIEPEARDTAPAVAAAAAYVAKIDPEGVIMMFAADHYIGELDIFLSCAAKAAAAAGEQTIVTFGVRPTLPSTAYGYIRPGKPRGEHHLTVDAFVEKPDRNTALDYLAAGYLWNSGMFAFPAALLVKELEDHAPEVIKAATLALEQARKEGGRISLDASAFKAAPKISLDYAVMEKTSHAVVIPAEFTWSDLGAWDAIWEISPKDDRDNVTSGPTLVRASRGSIVRSDGPLVALVGMQDTVVVAEAGSVLVCSRAHAQDVKTIAALAAKVER